MAARSRRRPAGAEHASEEGPFVSFTDLFIGILFLFLILVAALMLMHQEAVEEARSEAERMSGQILQLQAERDAINKLDADHPPFRLAIVYNSFQRAAGDRGEWTYSRTVQVFRAPNGLCINNVILRSNLSLAWKPPVKAEAIPRPNDQAFVRMGTPCTLSGSGEHWNSESETGSVGRVSPSLYSGASVLHKSDGDVTLDIQYRVLGVYDDYYRQATAAPSAPSNGRRGV